MFSVAFVMSADLGSVMVTLELEPGASNTTEVRLAPSEKTRNVTFPPSAGPGRREKPGTKSAHTKSTVAGLADNAVSSEKNTRTRV